MTVDESKLPTADDVRFFEENGYWLGGKVITDSEIAALHTAMDEVFASNFETGREPYAGGWKDNGDPTGIRKTDNSSWANRTLLKLATNPTVGAMAARLMKTPAVRLWHDQLLYKPGQGAAAASRAGNVGWHQDHGYWRCAQPDLITAWVALVDVTLENGCMQVVPGSHRWGLLPESDFFNTDLDGMKNRLEEHTGQPINTEPCTLKAGEVSFHHCLTIHGSGPNSSNAPRRSLVLHLLPDHATYVADTPDDNHMCAILMRELGRRPGDKFQGPYWPQLHPATPA
jgi:ectoine hydroxylase-related dioxygenase (phytanoyl-CoA dioxygenase family)